MWIDPAFHFSTLLGFHQLSKFCRAIFLPVYQTL